MNKKHFGLIDIGSNSIRLVIFQLDQQGYYKEVQNLKVVARLSSHIDTNGVMTETGISKLIEALQNFQVITHNYKITKFKCVATQALRQAQNQEQILAKVSKDTDFTIEVLSDYEEAFFGFLAVTNSTNIHDGITIDIGGGSTEVTLFKDRKLVHFHSFPFGAITLKQKFIIADKPSIEEKIRLTSFLNEQFSSLNWLQNNEALPLIGIGGSARNLSLISQRKQNYPLRGLHQYEMSYMNIREITYELNELPLKERQKVDGLSKERADIIIPAAEAICTLMEVTKTTKFIMSNKGLRDGLFYQELFNELSIEMFSNVVSESFYQLSREYNVNLENVNYQTRLVTQLFNELKDQYWTELSKEDLRLLHYGCQVLYIGEFISQETSSEHTFYLLTNKSVDGLTHIERLKIALIASFKSKNNLYSYMERYRDWFSEEEITKLELLGAILKFTYALNRTNRHVITQIKLTLDEAINVKLFFRSDPYFEKAQALKYKKHLEKAFKMPVILMFTPMP